MKRTRRHFIRSCLFSLFSFFSLTGLTRGIKKNRNFSIWQNIKNQDPNEPSYLRLHVSGQLEERGEELWESLRNCKLCPRKSAVNRFSDSEGTCSASSKLRISSFFPHFGEEKPLTGRNGSGTIFFSHCGLRCVYCQNWEISIGGQGINRTFEELANMMLQLQDRGCHNINVVTPTHYIPQIILALNIAASKGLRIPLVYNTGGYEDPEIIEKLDGIVDIYLPDFKYWESEMAGKYSSGAENYPLYAKEALIEMNRQVGVAIPDNEGIMRRGLMIRHLVLPNNISGTDNVLKWIAGNLPRETYVNLMAQYSPHHRAEEFPELNRRLYREEYVQAVEWAREAGLTNVHVQGSV